MHEVNERTIDTPNGQHHVRVAGSGDPIMVVPGGPGWGADYMIDSLTEALGSNHQLVFIDQRGTGGSPVGSGPLTVGAFVNDMAEVADQLDLDRFDLLGHSFGGLQVLLFVIACPQRVARVVIADGDSPTRELWEQSFGPGSPFSRRRRPEDAAEVAAITDKPDWMDDQKMLDRYLIATYRPLYASPATAASIRHGMDAGRFAQMELTTRAVRDDLRNWDISEELADVRAPVLLVYGRESIHGTATPEELHRLLPESDLVWVNGGHAPFIEDPEAFTLAVSRFLDD